MLLEYLRAAVRKARYEILTGDSSYYGEIPGFDGVYANADTLERCREELEEVLEEWVLFRVSRRLPLPVVDGIEPPDSRSIALEASREIQEAFRRSGITGEELRETGKRVREELSRERWATTLPRTSSRSSAPRGQS